MVDIRIKFTMDEPYFREFFEEWVSAVGRGWRIDRIMIPTFGLVGIGSCVAGLVMNFRPLFGLGAIALLAALFEAWKYARRRADWYRFCRSLPWYGLEMRIAVRNGALVQENEYDGDPRFDRTVPILRSPNGYLVRYVAKAPIEAPSPEISRTNASLYIPHRAITPPMSREDFANLIPADGPWRSS